MSIGTPPVTVQGVIADGLAGKTNFFGTLKVLWVFRKSCG